MEFRITLEPATLAVITKRLTPLAEVVTYQPGTPGKLSIDKFDPANETVIVDMLTDVLPTVNEVPTWAELTKTQGKRRQAMAA